MRNNNKRRPYNKNNGRNKKNYNPLRSQFDSNGPIGKVRGTAQQIADKYVVASREAKVSGDRVKAEELLQCSEHYMRMIVEYRLENPNYNEKENGDKEKSENDAKNQENDNSQEETETKKELTDSTETDTSTEKEAS